LQIRRCSKLLGTLHASDSSRKFGAEQPAVGGFIREPSNGGKPLVDAGCGEPACLKAKREARLRAVPRNELVDGELVRPAGSGGTKAVEDGGFRMVEIAEPEHLPTRL